MEDKAPEFEGPGVYVDLNVNPMLKAANMVDENGNPTGGYVRSRGLTIDWQNGPRAQEGTDELLPPNGAFVEDAIYAALQRLQAFQDSKYAHEANARAIGHLDAALMALESRRKEREERGVEGRHEV